jgi:hypothetical protein
LGACSVVAGAGAGGAAAASAALFGSAGVCSASRR